jgi:hypothetical protein
MSAPRSARSTLVAALAALGVATAASAAPTAPAPCHDVPQITDVIGDGHHTSSDVLSAWFSEAAGSLQAVIEVHNAIWKPEHDDADINGSGFAMLFSLPGRTDYVRARAAPDGTLTYDYGTYTAPNTFTTVGATTGSAIYGVDGTVTMDVPPALGATAGALVGNPYVLTYDGITGGVPAWVDQAPGGVTPGDSARGADYVVGSCNAGAGGGPATPGGGGTAPGGGSVPGGSSAASTTAVLLRAPRRLVGSSQATITGSVVPAQSGLGVAIARAAHAGTVTSHVRTTAAGTFKVTVPVRETTRVRAKANAISSRTLTIEMLTRVRIRVQRSRSGAITIRGTYSPSLPGRAVLLPQFSATPTLTRKVTGGRFSLHLARHHLPHGRVQVVYVPSASRAERSTSNSVSISQGVIAP